MFAQLFFIDVAQFLASRGIAVRYPAMGVYIGIKKLSNGEIGINKLPTIYFPDLFTVREAGWEETKISRSVADLGPMPRIVLADPTRLVERAQGHELEVFQENAGEDADLGLLVHGGAVVIRTDRVESARQRIVEWTRDLAIEEDKVNRKFTGTTVEEAARYALGRILFASHAFSGESLFARSLEAAVFQGVQRFRNSRSKELYQRVLYEMNDAAAIFGLKQADRQKLARLVRIDVGLSVFEFGPEAYMARVLRRIQKINLEDDETLDTRSGPILASLIRIIRRNPAAFGFSLTPSSASSEAAGQSRFPLEDLVAQTYKLAEPEAARQMAQAIRAELNIGTETREMASEHVILDPERAEAPAASTSP